MAVTNTELEGEKKLRKEISDNDNVSESQQLESEASKDDEPFEQREEISDGINTVTVKKIGD